MATKRKHLPYCRKYFTTAGNSHLVETTSHVADTTFLPFFFQYKNSPYSWNLFPSSKWENLEKKMAKNLPSFRNHFASNEHYTLVLIESVPSRRNRWGLKFQCSLRTVSDVLHCLTMVKKWLKTVDRRCQAGHHLLIFRKF